MYALTMSNREMRVPAGPGGDDNVGVGGSGCNVGGASDSDGRCVCEIGVGVVRVRRGPLSFGVEDEARRESHADGKSDGEGASEGGGNVCERGGRCYAGEGDGGGVIKGDDDAPVSATLTLAKAAAEVLIIM